MLIKKAASRLYMYLIQDPNLRCGILVHEWSSMHRQNPGYNASTDTRLSRVILLLRDRERGTGGMGLVSIEVRSVPKRLSLLEAMWLASSMLAALVGGWTIFKRTWLASSALEPNALPIADIRRRDGNVP